MIQKKTITCPKCGTSIEVTNPKSESHLLITCTKCAAKLRVLFATGTIIVAPSPDKRVIGWLECNGVKYELEAGENTIGRKSPTSEATIQISTDDKTVSRKHAKIEIVKLDNGRVKAVLSDIRKAEKSAIKPMYFGDEEIYPEDRLDLEDGDTFKLGELLVKYVQRSE